jgi:hypothetical protein
MKPFLATAQPNKSLHLSACTSLPFIKLVWITHGAWSLPV